MGSTVINFSLELDDNGTAKLRKFGDQVEKTAQKHEKAVSGMTQAAKSLGLSYGAAWAAAKTAATIAITEGMEYGGMIADNAQKFGVSTKALGGMALAAKLGGLEVDKLAGGMGKMAKLVGEANEGGAKQIQTLDSLNIQWKNQDGTLKNQSELMQQVAERFSKMPDGIQKTAEAQKIFGKSGADMIPMLNAGAEGLQEMQEKAEKLGLAFDELDASKLDDLGDNFDTMMMGMKGAATQFTLEAAPGMTVFFEDMQNMITDSMPFIRQLGKNFGNTMQFMGGAVNGLIGSMAKMVAFGYKSAAVYEQVAKLTAFGDARKQIQANIDSLNGEAKFWSDYGQQRYDKANDIFDRAPMTDKDVADKAANAKWLADAKKAAAEKIAEEKERKKIAAAEAKQAQKAAEKAAEQKKKDAEKAKKEAEEKAQKAAEEAEKKRQQHIKDQNDLMGSLSLEAMDPRSRAAQELQNEFDKNKAILEDSYAGMLLLEQNFAAKKAALESDWAKEDYQKLQDLRSAELAAAQQHIQSIEDAWYAMGDLSQTISKAIGANADSTISAVMQIGQALIAIQKMQSAMAAGTITGGLDMVAPGLGIATQLIGGISGFFASGGVVDRPRVVMAGEQGPEGILNARATRTLGKDFVRAANAGRFEALPVAGKSNKTIQVNIQTTSLSQREIEAVVIPAIQRAQRRL